ncbi:MAG TPA: YceI family protein [Myxococcales bacterium]|nr:YceI family protein [Myxococcales bacterium]
MTQFGPATAACEVFTFREGVFAAVGHDLKLRVERFEIEADRTKVSARFDANSLRVVAAMRGGKEDTLPDRDRAEIERNIVREVLETHRHPEIRFVSTAIFPGRVRGTLSLHGRESSGEFPFEESAGRCIASIDLDVRRFGIRPYSAMLGALRVAPIVRVVVSTPSPDV